MRKRMLRGLIPCLMAVGLMGAMTLPAAAEVVCRESALLGGFDGDGNGVVSIGEIRTADPSNARLQEIAGELEAEGIEGIRYAGCTGTGDGGSGTGDGGTGDGGTGTGNGGSGNGGSGTGDGDTGNGGGGTGNSGNGSGTASGTGDGGTGTASGDDGSSGGTDNGNTGDDGTAGWSDAADDLVITVLPNTGDGSSIAQSGAVAEVMVAMSAAGIAALGALWFTIRRHQRG